MTIILRRSMIWCNLYCFFLVHLLLCMDDMAWLVSFRFQKLRLIQNAKSFCSWKPKRITQEKMTLRDASKNGFSLPWYYDPKPTTLTDKTPHTFENNNAKSSELGGVMEKEKRWFGFWLCFSLFCWNVVISSLI